MIVNTVGMTEHIIILHGWESAPDRHWFPWLKQRLEAVGLRVSVPALPDTMMPKKEAWLSTTEDLIDDPAQTILLGHSLGGTTILRLLEKWQQAPFRAVMPVASPIRSDREELASFFDTEIDFDTARKNTTMSACIYGEDDPRVPIEQGKECAQKLGASLFTLQNVGHLRTQDGVTTLSEAEEFILALCPEALQKAKWTITGT